MAVHTITARELAAKYLTSSSASPYSVCHSMPDTPKVEFKAPEMPKFEAPKLPDAPKFSSVVITVRCNMVCAAAHENYAHV